MACYCCGAPEGTRTPNLLIRSQMLYPLSYGRMSSGDNLKTLPSCRCSGGQGGERDGHRCDHDSEQHVARPAQVDAERDEPPMQSSTASDAQGVIRAPTLTPMSSAAMRAGDAATGSRARYAGRLSIAFAPTRPAKASWSSESGSSPSPATRDNTSVSPPSAPPPRRGTARSRTRRTATARARPAAHPGTARGTRRSAGPPRRTPAATPASPTPAGS
jgi:hypothetical protein